MSDTLEVASSGTIPRDDRCGNCGKPMMYRLDQDGVAASFCVSAKCSAFLLEIEEPMPSEDYSHPPIPEMPHIKRLNMKSGSGPKPE